jgi:phenylalanyl-tRNA synthetase beta subunit
MNLENAYRESVAELGYDLDEIYKIDDETRNKLVKNANNDNLNNNNPYNKNISDMAESLIDSLATLELPAWGYGLRYKFGNLKQYRQSLRSDF